MSDVQWVVRVRIPRANAWPSPPMPRSEAISAAAALRSLIRDESDGPGFIEFEANGGRLVHIRAREVLSVETDQWKSRSPEPASTSAAPVTGTFSDGSTLTVHPLGPPEEDDATAFLRRQARAQTAGR